MGLGRSGQVGEGVLIALQVAEGDLAERGGESGRERRRGRRMAALGGLAATPPVQPEAGMRYDASSGLPFAEVAPPSWTVEVLAGASVEVPPGAFKRLIYQANQATSLGHVLACKSRIRPPKQILDFRRERGGLSS